MRLVKQEVVQTKYYNFIRPTVILYKELYAYWVQKTEILKFKPILAPSGLAPEDICRPNLWPPIATRLFSSQIQGFNIQP